ncbi:MAG: hypothetical protein Q8T13_09020 [Acidobacteriota bacterium]|nr:hypothetical protein [Acidobacteriota bacterium]
MSDRSTEIPPDARAAADRGELIEAIKITRQVSSLGLKEAKEAVDAYLPGATPTSIRGEVQIPLQAVSALHQGSLIDAIKRTREATGLGLKDSKEAVEQYLAKHANTNEQYRAAARLNRGNSRLFVTGGLIVVAAAIVWWLSRT